MINFDLSLPDDDEWLDNLETEDDYKDREEYDRSMTPPSPSLLDIEDLIQEEDDIHNESEEYQPPPAKKRLLSRNPFMDEDETPKKKQVSTLKSTNTSMNSVLDKLERVDLSVLSPEAVIKAQYFIIQYLKSLVEPKNIPAAVEKTLKVISDYNPASGDHEYDYDQDHMEPPNSPVFNSQSPCTSKSFIDTSPSKYLKNNPLTKPPIHETTKSPMQTCTQEIIDDEEVIEAGETLCEIESVKSAATIGAPISGTPVSINDKLGDEDGKLMNADPENTGYLCEISAENVTDAVSNLMTQEAYDAFLEEEK